MKKINIGLLGCGTVGTGVAKLLIENKALLSSRVGAHLNLKWIADIDTETDRGIRFPDGVFVKDANKVINDPEIDIVIEMIGGEGIAKESISLPPTKPFWPVTVICCLRRPRKGAWTWLLRPVSVGACRP